MKVNPHLSASTPLRGAAPSGALPVNRRRLRLGLAILLAAMTGFRYYYILHGHLNLDPDEAHYWEWSRHLAMGYYSKGPVIAWLIRAGTALFGNTELGVRFFAPVLYLLGSILLYRLGKELFDEKTGIFTAALFQVVPLFSAFGVIMTIDAPAVFLWILSLYLFHKAMRDKKTVSWTVLGLAVGIGMLTKLTMSFFILSAFLYMVSSEEGRREFSSVRPYIGFLACLVFLVPLFYWNSRHNWVNFRHEEGHLNWAAGIAVSPGSFFQFLGSQLGVVTPVLFALILYALVRTKNDKAGRFCFWFAAPTLVFFFLKSIFLGKVQANWAMCAYITGLIAATPLLLRGFGPGARPGARFFMSLAPAIAVLVTAVSYYPSIIGLPPRLDPSARLRGWRQLASAVEENAPPSPYFVFSDYYGASSELAFYLKGNPATYCANTGERMNQYDLWPGFEGFKRRNAVFVTIGSANMPRAVAAAFGSCRKKV
ncbi:MAG: glycosyltransferase family 39 protein, partial [Nitrospiraceae bacterium]|nr:glycosyltransferase family 39 protein [Nitrospiraceae bacterium]